MSNVNKNETSTLPEVTLTKEYGIGKANADLKARVFSIIEKALKEEGLEPMWVRNGNKSSEVNELAVVAQTIIKDGMSYDHCVCINPTVKSIEDKVVKGNVVPAFDIISANENYNLWVEEKTEKEEKKKKEKADKIAKDTARREKAKAKAKETEQSE